LGSVEVAQELNCLSYFHIGVCVNTLLCKQNVAENHRGTTRSFRVDLRFDVLDVSVITAASVKLRLHC